MKNLILIFVLFISAQYAFADNGRVVFRQATTGGQQDRINESIKVCCQNEEAGPVGPGFTCARQGAATRQCLQQIAGQWQSYMQQEERVMVGHIVRFCGETYTEDRVRAACVSQTRNKIANNEPIDDRVASASVRWRHMQSANFILGNLALTCELASGNSLNGNQVTRMRREDCQYQRVEHVTLNRLTRCFHRDSENTQPRDFNNPIEARRMWACSVGVGGTTRQMRQFSDEARTSDISESDDNAPSNTTDLAVERNFENIWNQLGDSGTASQFGQCANQANQGIQSDTFREMNCRRVERDQTLSNFSNHVVGIMEMGDASQYLDLLRLEAVSLTLHAVRRNFGNPRIRVPAGCRRIQQGFDNIMSQSLSVEDQNHLNNVRSSEYAQGAQAAALRILRKLKPEVERLPTLRLRVQRQIADAQATGRPIPEHLFSALDRIDQRRRDIREQILADFNRYPALAVNHDYSREPWQDIPSVSLMARSPSPRDTLRGISIHLLNGYQNQVDRLCNTRAISWQDLIRDNSLNNTVLSRYPEFSAIRQCLSNMVQREDDTRHTVLMAGMLGCGAVAAVVGAAATPLGLTGAGFAMGLACASLQVAGSYREYEIQQRRFSLTSSCKMIMGEDEEMCSTEEYLRARENFEEAISQLQTDLALGVTLDILLPGLVELAPFLRTARLASAQRRVRTILSEAQELGHLSDEMVEELNTLGRQLEEAAWSGNSSPSTGSYQRRDYLKPDPQTGGGLRSTPDPGESIARMFLSNAEQRWARYNALDIALHNEAIERYLSEQGIEFATGGERSLFQKYFSNANSFSPDELPSMFRLETQSAATGARNPLTRAVEHPGLQDLIDDMNNIGVSIYVDTSIPLQRGSRGSAYGAYFRRGTSAIGISPDSTWSTLLHEAQHAYFDRLVRSRWQGMQILAGLTEEQRVARAATDETFAQLLELHNEAYANERLYRESFDMATAGHAQSGIDETMATRVQERALLNAGYTRLNENWLSAREYGLRQQINNLERQQSLVGQITNPSINPAQSQRALAAARRDLRILRAVRSMKRSAQNAAYAAAGAGGGLAIVGTGVAIVNPEGVEVFFNELTGMFVFRDGNGGNVILSKEQVDSMFDDSNQRFRD